MSQNDNEVRRDILQTLLKLNKQGIVPSSADLADKAGILRRVLNWHVSLLVDEGLIRGTRTQNLDMPIEEYLSLRVTSEGVDYLHNNPEANPDEKIRDSILQAIYKFRRENPDFNIDDEELRGFVGDEVTDKDYEYNLERLIEEGLIERPAIQSIDITPAGKACVEGPSKFSQNLSPQINITNITIDSFLVNFQQAIERADLSDEEKKGLLGHVKALASHPISSSIASHILIQLLKNYGLSP